MVVIMVDDNHHIDIGNVFLDVRVSGIVVESVCGSSRVAGREWRE